MVMREAHAEKDESRDYSGNQPQSRRRCGTGRARRAGENPSAYSLAAPALVTRVRSEWLRAESALAGAIFKAFGNSTTAALLVRHTTHSRDAIADRKSC